MQNNQLNDQEITKDLVQSLILERRRERRWKNIRFFLVLFIFLVIVASIFSNDKGPMTTEGEGGKGYVSLIRLDGMIAPGEDFSAEHVIPLLSDAFKDKNSKGVMLVIDSGGGTPVQASIIHDAIIELKNKYHKKVVVVGEDLLASGAYFVAVAGDKIYVNPNTVTGSIGVIMKGFGLVDLIKRFGIERRVYTAGANKDRLDPFLPQTSGDIEKIQSVISEVHNNFIQVVLEGRKGKLTTSDTKELFSGDFWSGQTALKLGLVDGLGNMYDVMKTEFKVTRYKDYSDNATFKNLIGKFGTSFGTAITNDQVKLISKI